MNPQNLLKESVQYIKGVGPKRYDILNRIGVYTLGDLLYYFPRRYEDRRSFMPIAQLRSGEHACVKAKVIRIDLWRSKRGLLVFELTLRDPTGTLEALWFNQPFLRRYFKIGQELILYGKAEKLGRMQMNVPDFELVTGKDTDLHMGRIVPVYPLTASLNQRYLRTIMHRALEKCAVNLADLLDYNLRNKLGLLPLTLALRAIHFPEDFPKKDQAYRRIVFEEFFLLQMILALNKFHRVQSSPGIAHNTEGKLIEEFRRTLPFALTAGQEKAIKEIEQDMQSPRAMNRLLQGDVGSGKTIVAAYAIILSVQSGFQSALMAPTEILAEQHFFTLSKLLLPLDIKIGLMVGSMSQAAREQIWQDLQDGAIQVVVGTHALIEEAVRFKKLGLVVIDEQHKFGVLQRSFLREKGMNPDCLFLTATPIPRTLAMTVYGDLDISTIRELPKGRLPISTFCIEQSAIKNAYRFAQEEIKKGRQAYIVYPLVKKSASLELKAASEMHARLKEEEFRDFSVGLIHGQMKGEEKEKVMRDFKNKKIDILVSTTVIEVGIDVPNASVMIVEHAERFGLSQLHQLRGRIGRGPYPSYCLLVSEPETEQAKRRIDAMLSTQDGFELAEVDLDIRGPGQMFGSAQHGLPDFLKLGNIVRDMELLELARREAGELVKEDPYLKRPEHLLLKKTLREKYSFVNLELLSV